MEIIVGSVSEGGKVRVFNLNNGHLNLTVEGVKLGQFIRLGGAGWRAPGNTPTIASPSHVTAHKEK